MHIKLSQSLIQARGGQHVNSCPVDRQVSVGRLRLILH